jgi:hypothetical protein
MTWANCGDLVRQRFRESGNSSTEKSGEFAAKKYRTFSLLGVNLHRVQDLVGIAQWRGNVERW